MATGKAFPERIVRSDREPDDSTIVGTWRPGRLELYVDGFSRASSTAAATSTSALFGIYRWDWGFSTSQDFDGDIALIAASPPPGPPP
jgi:hypothetical protein